MPTANRRAWVMVVVWVSFVEVLTSLPGSALPTLALPFRYDWVAHFCMYGVLGMLLARAARVSLWPWPRLLLVALGVSAFGALDELHQLWIPGRDAEVMDWLMDTTGSATGIVGFVLAMRFDFWRWLI
jgi:VanZ family protein